MEVLDKILAWIKSIIIDWCIGTVGLVGFSTGLNLNVCMDKALHEEFEAFCKAHGMSKVGATEQAIRQYMDKMNKALKNVK